MDNTLPQRRSFLLAALIGLPFAARLVLVWQDFERLVKSSPLLEDDYFYCLNIARHVVGGSGFSADGETLTTGFQWCHELLVIAVTALTGSGSELPFRIILTLQVLLSLAAVWFLRRLVARFSGGMEATVAAIMFAWWLPILRYGNNGLETILAIVLLLWFADAVIAFHGSPSKEGARLTGLLAGLCVLGRIDLVAAGAAGLALLLTRFLREKRERPVLKTGLFWVGGGTLLGLAAVMGANSAINGSPWPDSGVAVQELAGLYALRFGYSVDVIPALARVAGTLLADHPLAQSVALTGIGGWGGNVVVLTLLGVSLMWWRQSGVSGGLLSLTLMLAVIGGLLAGLYVLVAPAFWFLSRYLFPVSVLILVVSTFPFTLVMLRMAPWKRTWGKMVTGVLLVLYAGAFVERWSGFMFDPIEHISDQALTSGAFEEAPVCHNYDIARWIELNSLPETRIAMWQGGLVSYMVRPFILHLDGVVNREGLEAWKSGRVYDYLLSKRIETFVDFESVAELALGPDAASRGVTKLGTTGCPEGLKVAVYSITGR